MATVGNSNWFVLHTAQKEGRDGEGLSLKNRHIWVFWVPSVNRETFLFFPTLYTKLMDVNLYVLQCRSPTQQPGSPDIPVDLQYVCRDVLDLASGDTLTWSTSGSCCSRSGSHSLLAISRPSRVTTTSFVSLHFQDTMTPFSRSEDGRVQLCPLCVLCGLQSQEPIAAHGRQEKFLQL